MAQYDGSIRIITEISTEMAKKSLGTLSNMITLTAKEISSLRSKMDALKGQKFYTDDYKELQSELVKTEETLSSLIEKQNEWKNTKVFGISLWENLNKEIDATNDNINSIKNNMRYLEDAGKAFTLGEDTQEYSNYERQLQYEQAALEEATKQYQALDKLKDPYGRLSQALTDLNGKLSSILRPIQKIQSAFAQDIKVSGYEKLQSSLGELGGIAIRVAETVKNTFATLKQGKQGVVAVIHSLSSSLLNMANTVNSAIGSMLSEGFEKFFGGIGAIAEKVRQIAAGIGSAISSVAKGLLGKLAGLVGSGLNLILHPFQTLKNVATTTLGGVANIIKGVLGSALEGLKNRVAGLAASIINGIVHPFQTLKKIGSSAVKGVTKLFSGMITVAKKAGKAISSIASILKRATSSMLGFGKSAKNTNGVFGGGLKNILKYGLGIRSLYALINKLRTAITEGFTNLYNEVDGFKSSVDGLKASLTTLKNSFAAAFRPLVEIAVPYIQKAVDALANLMDMIGQFTAAITGQKTYTKAIKQTTAAIEDENAAQNKQLSGLDKLNNLSSGSGGSSDSGASTQMFEENVPLSDKFADMAQQLKDMWGNADFSGLGEILGGKLKSALENIPWDSIKQTIAKAGKSFATLINGIVEVPGLALDIGENIGEAINTGISGINAFLDNTNWDSVGKFIGEGLNGLINSINWQDIGHFFAAKYNAIFETLSNAIKSFNWTDLGTNLSNGIVKFIKDLNTSHIGKSISEAIKGLLDMIISFFENTNWRELGSTITNKIGDLVSSIDWNGVFDRLAEGIGAIIGGIGAFIAGLIGDSFGDGVLSSYFSNKIDEAGGNIVKGIYNGITEGLSNIGTWIYEHIFEPFIEGFKSAFGIHSPSTVMAEMGIYIMQGLLNGIKSLVSTVVGAIQDVWNGIKTVFEGFITFLSGVFTGKWGKAWGGIVKIFSGVGDAIKGIVNGILGVIETLANGVINGINFVIGALNKLHIDIPAPIAKLTGFESFGFDIPELSQVSIPRLATGTVVPPNREFMAVLGDNKREPEVVSPISTMKQANKEAILEVFSELGLTGGRSKSGNETFVFQVDGKTFFEIMRGEAERYFKRTGRTAFPI